jgi:hypothetical protein
VSSILMGVPASIKRSTGKNHYRLTLWSFPSTVENFTD